jgi:hypothetical protein
MLLVTGACSADHPYYTSDEVILILKQQLHLVDHGSLTQDRYGAKLVGKPIVTNFRLSDWEAKYLGMGKWGVSAQAIYYNGVSKETTEFHWLFHENTSNIEYIGNGEHTLS